MTTNPNLSPSKRRTAWLSAAALAALIAGGAVESGLVPPAPPAYAQAPAVAASAMPSFADVVDKVKPAVVSVRVKISTVADRGGDEGEAFGLPDLPPGSPMERFFRRFQDEEGGRGFRFRQGPGQGPGPRRNAEAQGSGFFISADGYVVTNNHVVDHASEMQVVMDDGRTLDAKVVGTDPKTDLALLKVKEGGDFAFVPFAAKSPRVGDWVVAIGNPFGLGGTVTAGIVSARGRDIGAGPYDDFLQIDAPVNRGNSGGPTFNLNGEVVGINTAIASPSGGSVGIAFAIPSESAQAVVASLKANGTVARGFIGVQIQPVTNDIAEAMGLKERKGALVAEVVRGGPAEKAGLKRGDAVVAVEGQPIREPKDLSRRIAAFEPGKSVSLTVLRDGKERAVTIEIGRQNERA
jgi:serine protease Do